MNWQLADAFVLPRHPECLLLDLATNVVEVGEALVDMQELAPFCVCRCGFSDWRVDKL